MSIPAMTSERVHEYLTTLGKGWTGQGVAMELGCWLGASSVALLKGLVKAEYDLNYWAFDRWTANQEQVDKAKAQGQYLFPGQSTEGIFQGNTMGVYSEIKTVRGNLPGSLLRYHNEEAKLIEICLFDAPKQEPIFTGCFKELQKYFIPGVTIFGLLDYKFYERHSGKKRKLFKAPVDFMEKYGDNFTWIQDWEDETVVFFRYEKRFKL